MVVKCGKYSTCIDEVRYLCITRADVPHLCLVNARVAMTLRNSSQSVTETCLSINNVL